MQSHTRSHTDKPMHALCILPAYDISYDVTSMGRRRLSYSDSQKSHNSTSNTHTTALHESPCPHPITPPCPSCCGTSLALCISSTSTEQSAAQWHHEAQSRSLGLSLFMVLQLDYPITNGKYLGKWGLNIFAI